MASTTLSADRKLLNPMFDGYVLGSEVSTVSLPVSLSHQDNIRDANNFPYNFLMFDPQHRLPIVFSNGAFLCLCKNGEDLQAREVFSFPTPFTGDDNPGRAAPSGSFVQDGPKVAALSDGDGSLIIVSTEDGQWQPLSDLLSPFDGGSFTVKALRTSAAGEDKLWVAVARVETNGAKAVHRVAVVELTKEGARYQQHSPPRHLSSESPCEMVDVNGDGSLAVLSEAPFLGTGEAPPVDTGNAEMQDVEEAADDDKKKQDGLEGMRMLEECDSFEVGRLVLRIAGASSSSPSTVSLGSQQFLCETQMLGRGGKCLVLRHDVDGVAWAPTDDGRSFCHVSTFPAFGYVQASKSDRKFLAFDPEYTLAVVGSTQRVFLYVNPGPGRVAKSSQHVFELPLSEGELLGVCVVDGKTAVAATASTCYWIELPA